MFCAMPPCHESVPVWRLLPVAPCVWLFTAWVLLRLKKVDVMFGRYAASRSAREKSDRRGVMRATPMSMFFSRARATASSIDRSTRGPDVRKGAVDCAATAAVGVWPAGTCGAAGVCAIAGETAASTSAAAVTTFFVTIASNTLGMKPGLPLAAPVARPLLAHLLGLLGHLDALLGRQQLVDAVEHQGACLAGGGARRLDLVDLRDDGCFVGRSILDHLIQLRLELLELGARFHSLRQPLLPD